MKRFDRINSIVFLVLGAIVIWQSAIIPMGDINKPGPGFLPFWVGILMAIFSISLWFLAGSREPISAHAKFLSGERRWISVILTTCLLFAFAYWIETLGFIISTFLLLLFLFRVIGHQKWWAVFTGTVLVTLAAHILFKVIMKVQLPVGLFRI
jgi:putative tricarboxylic transport membrane protein